MAKKESADKVMRANKLVEKIQTLNNTVAHLESRLEIANTNRLDAEEQLSAWKDQKSPFDLIFPEPPASASGLYGSKKSAQTAPVAHIEALQSQVKEKDTHIAELKAEIESLQQRHNELEHEHKRVAVQSDLQHELLRETRASDKLVEQLRTAVVNHESTIMENEQTIHALRRQLEYHKLLLQAEIRRHTVTKLYVAAEEHSLPELTTLAKREDIDLWMEKLHEQLKREQSENESKAVTDTPEAKIESLRHEIDFYVREIILFKLDIKGYKNDIRKLKELAAHQGSSQQLANIEEEAPPMGAAASPVQSHFSPITPELDAFLNASSAIGHTDTSSKSEERFTSPLTSACLFERRGERADRQFLESEIPQDFRILKDNSSFTSEADRVDSAISPSSNAPQVSECPKSSVCVH